MPNRYLSKDTSKFLFKNFLAICDFFLLNEPRVVVFFNVNYEISDFSLSKWVQREKKKDFTKIKILSIETNLYETEKWCPHFFLHSRFTLATCWKPKVFSLHAHEKVKLKWTKNETILHFKTSKNVISFRLDFQMAFSSVGRSFTHLIKSSGFALTKIISGMISLKPL